MRRSYNQQVQQGLYFQWDCSSSSDDNDELPLPDRGFHWLQIRGMPKPSRGRWRGQNKRRGQGRGLIGENQFPGNDAFSLYRSGISTQGQMLEYSREGKIELCQQVSAVYLDCQKPTGSAVQSQNLPQPSVRGKQTRGTCSEISVASYNVLAQCYIEEMADQLYQHCPQRFLAWSYRRNLIIRQLEINQPDIICLQEVQFNHYHDFFCPQLRRLGYEGHYKQRSGDKMDGCASFYKRDKFVCSNAVPVEYRVPGSRLLDRDNVALLLVLSPRHKAFNNSFVCVINTHLLYNPKRGDIKLAQLMFLLAAADEVAAQTLAGIRLTYDPIILCGDFNFCPNSDLYSLLTDGQLEYDGACIQTMSGQRDDDRGRCLDVNFLPAHRLHDISSQCQFIELTNYRQQKQREPGRGRSRRPVNGSVSHEFSFQSAYRNDNGTLTAWLSNPPNGTIVDYIYYSCDENAKGQRLELLKVMNLPRFRDVKRAGGLPNEHQPSDHLMLMATFALKCG